RSVCSVCSVCSWLFRHRTPARSRSSAAVLHKNRATRTLFLTRLVLLALLSSLLPHITTTAVGFSLSQSLYLLLASPPSAGTALAASPVTTTTASPTTASLPTTTAASPATTTSLPATPPAVSRHDYQNSCNTNSSSTCAFACAAARLARRTAGAACTGRVRAGAARPAVARRCRECRRAHADSQRLRARHHSDCGGPDSRVLRPPPVQADSVPGRLCRGRLPCLLPVLQDPVSGRDREHAPHRVPGGGDSVRDDWRARSNRARRRHLPVCRLPQLQPPRRRTGLPPSQQAVRLILAS
ncbi:hypothetical protein GQ42DRAFT_180520, partial [Ramicandelaber brevisporus]